MSSYQPCFQLELLKNSEDDKKYWAIAASKDSMDSFIDLKKCVLHAGVVGRERMTSIGLVMFINR